MARETGLEPATSTVTGWHSNQLSYSPAPYLYHDDAQFAGSSSVPAHVEMMGLIGMGNNPMVGASVAVAVAVSEAL